MRQYMQDRLIALSGLVLVGTGLWLCTDYETDSALFPQICLLCIGVLLLLLAGESILTERRLKARGVAGQEALPMNFKPFLLVTATLAAYGAGMVILGFYTASALFILAVGFYWKGLKPLVIFLFTVCFMIFLYFCFTHLFNVPLPTGLLR